MIWTFWINSAESFAVRFRTRKDARRSRRWRRLSSRTSAFSIVLCFWSRARFVRSFVFYLKTFFYANFQQPFGIVVASGALKRLLNRKIGIGLPDRLDLSAFVFVCLCFLQKKVFRQLSAQIHDSASGHANLRVKPTRKIVFVGGEGRLVGAESDHVRKTVSGAGHATARMGKGRILVTRITQFYHHHILESDKRRLHCAQNADCACRGVQPGKRLSLSLFKNLYMCF